MAKSKIQWTERTWNPVTGCTKISEGCRHCYAETMAKRLQGMGQKRYTNGFQLTLNRGALNEPLKVKKPSMFFVCSMGDLFHRDVPFDFIDKVMQTIEATPQHTYQLVTKRTDVMRDYFNTYRKNVPANVWLGTTLEHMDYNWRKVELSLIECDNVKFLSCEPLLGDLTDIILKNIDWVIVGGESGSQARPMRKEWIQNIQRQCKEQDVPFFFKQWGTWGEDGIKRDKKANGCMIDGVVYQEFPRKANN